MDNGSSGRLVNHDGVVSPNAEVSSFFFATFRSIIDPNLFDAYVSSRDLSLRHRNEFWKNGTRTITRVGSGHEKREPRSAPARRRRGARKEILVSSDLDANAE